MDEDSWRQIESTIPKTYAKQACEAVKSRQKVIRILLQHKKLPEEGWDDPTIELFLQQLSLMDSNNFLNNRGLGEREARIASNLVARRHYNFGHGIGRSGDLNEPQPKAAGSSLMYALTNKMIEDLMKIMGLDLPVHCLLVPLATGMSLVLGMKALKVSRPKARYVIWSRIDQKSCFKSISTAGFEAVVVDTMKVGDQLETDCEGIKRKIVELGVENVLCVMTTTSCFAPRSCDNVEEVGRICKSFDLPHLINNAYGLQSKIIMKRILKAQRVGRVDFFVQSTDKNLMVPVGGAIISSFDPQLLEQVSRLYPGRASSSPILDAFITLLSLGKKGFLQFVDDRQTLYNILLEKMKIFAEKIGEKVLETPGNPISISLSLTKLPKEDLTKLGSMLFLRNISGTRVVNLLDNKQISSYQFKVLSEWALFCCRRIDPNHSCAMTNTRHLPRSGDLPYVGVTSWITRQPGGTFYRGSRDLPQGQGATRALYVTPMVRLERTYRQQSQHQLI